MDQLPRRQDQNLLQRKGHKRKLLDEYDAELEFPDEAPSDHTIWKPPIDDVKSHVSVLDTYYSWKESDRLLAKHAAHALAELAKNGTVFLGFFGELEFVLVDVMILIFDCCCRE